MNERNPRKRRLCMRFLIQHICFGSRGPEVQILSPRPVIRKLLRDHPVRSRRTGKRTARNSRIAEGPNSSCACSSARTEQRPPEPCVGCSNHPRRAKRMRIVGGEMRNRRTEISSSHSEFRSGDGERSSTGQSTGLWLQGLRVRVPPFTPTDDRPGDRILNW